MLIDDQTHLVYLNIGLGGTYYSNDASSYTLLDSNSNSDNYHVFRIAKTARKLNVGLTVITQDVLDLLASDAGKTVIANSSVQLLFKQAARAIPELAECFGVTRPEGLLLMNAPVGEGILIGRNSRTQLKVIASAAEDSVART